MIRVRSPNDLFVGFFLIAVAATGLWLTRDLRLGSAARMGPGYMPVALCWIMLALGAATVFRGLTVNGEAAEGWSLRPILLVSCAIGAFALAIDRLGLVVAIVLLVALGSLADPDSRGREVVALAIGLCTFSVMVFAKALGLPMPIWPEALQ